VLRRIAAGAASVSVTCPASLPLLDFPSEIIERITVNLVRNAAEAIRIHRATTPPSTPPPPPGKIQLTLSVVAGRLQLTVADNGPGMPPAVVAAYLRPTRLPHGASRGLGHRIVHELATSTHGQLSIRVRPGHGTLFCLTWPIPSSALDQRDGPDTSSLPSLMTA
jgi:signal transduction histidine kinase